MHQNTALATDHHTTVIAVGAPVLVEGLRGIGCAIDASTTIVEELPALAARFAPSQVLLAADTWRSTNLVALHRVRAMLPGCHLIVIAPEHLVDELRHDLHVLRAVVIAASATTATLRTALGLPTPTILTRREIEVLELTAHGLTNHAIARSLGLGDDTVKNYLRSVYRKLGARSRLEAVLLAARAGYPVLSLR